MKLNINSKIKLNDGNEIPVIGFGVFQIKDTNTCINSVITALDSGYSHIDTALAYGNEEAVGAAIYKSKIKREDIFITTKTPFDLQPLNIQKSFEQSLKKLRLDYADLYLIHWPFSDDLSPQWEVMLKLRDSGKCKSVGVSNFTAERFDKAFFAKGCSTPAVNQVEYHVFNQNKNIVNYCKNKGIAIESYSPLVRGKRFGDKRLLEMSRQYGKTEAQLMIRYVLQKGHVALPKSSTEKRIKENIDVFDFSISEKHMAELDLMDEGFVVQDWFPENFY